MAGDDTPALQAVLSADAWREHLLGEERKLTEQIAEDARRVAEGGKQDDSGLQERLNEIYSRLQEIESDKAEARASAILSGLGFRPESQKNATKTFSGGWRM
ncbi:MAG: hypothetical protein BJ554DRAFT_6116, partial [Olpidium bornovanus]